MFDQFHHFTSLPSSFASYFVTIIPKVNSLSHLGEFRLISLMGSLYKLVAKVLTVRLSSVIEKLISSKQSSFLKGRMMVDEVVDVNEVNDLAKRSKRARLILKVDFEKAYDIVSWKFLDYMLIRFRFYEK